MDWTRIPTITAPRVSLRPITEDDLESFYRIFSNPEVMRYWSTTPLTDRDEALKLLRSINQGFRDQALLKWGMVSPPDNALLGTVTLFNLDFNHHRAEIGYALGRDNWGQGYMHEALTAVLRYAFNELDFHRIEADVDPRNANSIRTLERLGFQREGYLRERWQVGGEIQDALFYGLLRPEWGKGK